MTTIAHPKASEDGWIEWSGGPCPVHVCAGVEVILRGTPDEVEPECPAGDYGYGPDQNGNNSNWVHDGSSLDIVRYRIVSA